MLTHGSPDANGRPSTDVIVAMHLSKSHHKKPRKIHVQLASVSTCRLYQRNISKSEKLSKLTSLCFCIASHISEYFYRQCDE